VVAIVAVIVGARTALGSFALSRADSLALDALASAIVLALAACAFGVFARDPLRVRLGLVRGDLDAGRIALAALGLVALSHVAEAVIELAGFSTAGLVRFDDALAGLHVEDVLFPLVALAFASAFGEELFFRGLLQRGMAARFGTAPAIVLASLAFGAAHGDWTHGGATAVLGTYLGVVAACAGSIRPAIAAHAANNAVALVEKAFELEGPSGPIATPLTVAVGVALAAVGLLAVSRPRRKPPVFLQSPTRCTDEPADE
jgi:membrane protease YdiL (CAAX protease family)